MAHWHKQNGQGGEPPTSLAGTASSQSSANRQPTASLQGWQKCFRRTGPTGALFIIQRFSDHQHPVSGPIPWANELTYVTLVNGPFGLEGGRRLRHHDPLSLVQRPNHGFWALSRFVVALGSCGWHPPISRFLVSVFWSRLLSALTHWIHRHASCVFLLCSFRLVSPRVPLVLLAHL